ncbi:MAG TPA: hypothetical protein VKY45_00355 [Marinilabiliaceae bacterium]|nr:hypothetical protein [Marinilabiliaceae bacterium]
MYNIFRTWRVFVITPGTDLIGPTTRKKEYLSIPVSLNDLAG